MSYWRDSLRPILMKMRTTKSRKKLSNGLKNYEEVNKQKTIHGYSREDAVEEDDVLVLQRKVASI